MVEKFERRSCRSDRYQEKFAECSVSSEMMESFQNDESISGRLAGGFAYDERVLELEDQLKEEFWRIVEMLTERQRDVLKLYAEGLTQMEIAKILGVNQSSITKSINGNSSYSETGNGKKHKVVYGGSQKRLSKIIETDDKINEILRLIQELRNEKW